MGRVEGVFIAIAIAICAGLAFIAIAPGIRATNRASDLIRLLGVFDSYEWMSLHTLVKNPRSIRWLSNEKRWRIVEALCERMVRSSQKGSGEALDELSMLYSNVRDFGMPVWRPWSGERQEKIRKGLKACLVGYWRYVNEEGLDHWVYEFQLGACLDMLARTEFLKDMFVVHFERALRAKILSPWEMRWIVAAVAKDEELRDRLNNVSEDIVRSVRFWGSDYANAPSEREDYAELLDLLAKVWPHLSDASLR